MSRELHDERISAYLDGELSPGERAEVEELLKTSSSHQQELAELTMLRESLQSLPSYTLGNDFAGRVTVAAQRAAQEGAREVRPNQQPALAETARRNWLQRVVGGIAIVAASVAIVVYAINSGNNNIAKVQPEETGGETVKQPIVEKPIIEEPVASEFVRALSSTQDNEALVVRVKLTKDALRGRLLDEALKAHGIQMATPDVSNEAARQTGLAYKEQVKSQVASAGSPGAADVLFLEADAEQLEKALTELEKNPVAKADFTPESLVASVGQGPVLNAKPEGEPNSAGPETKIPTGGYFQHMPPRGFTLAPAASSAIKPREKGPAKKSARVLIVVEVVD